jgi:hypothetical protein
MTQAYVYKWIHLPTMKWYVGSRYKSGCHPSDGYICSSKIVRPLIQSRPWEWQRNIIGIGSKEEMLDLEREILTLFDAAKDSRSFNQTNGAGKFSGRDKPHTKETKDKMRLAQKDRNRGLTYEQIHGEEKARKLKEKLANKKGPNIGRIWEEEIREKQRIAAINRPPVSQETKLKMSQSQRGKKAKLSVEEVYEIKYILTYKECKLKYNHKVSMGTIEQIRGGSVWKWV